MAILSSTILHASRAMSLASPTLGRAGAKMSLAVCILCGQHLNAYGLLDLDCNLHTPLTGFQAGDANGILMGKTVSGAALQGQDSVHVFIKKK